MPRAHGDETLLVYVTKIKKTQTHIDFTIKKLIWQTNNQ